MYEFLNANCHLLKSIIPSLSSQLNHLRCLHEFAEAQAKYYAQCHQFMLELQKELNGSVFTAQWTDYKNDGCCSYNVWITLRFTYRAVFSLCSHLKLNSPK